MFAVYSPQGRSFLGTLEQLRRVEKASHLTASRRVADPSIDQEFADTQHEKHGSSHAESSISTIAIDQYKSMLTDKGQPEPVYHAYQIMSKPVVTLQSDWSMQKARERIQSTSYQVFPVVNEYQELLGYISRQQYYEFILANDESKFSMDKTIAICFLTPDLQTYAVDPVTDVRRIAQVLVDKNLDALPVVKENGEVIGIVSRTDILRCTTLNPPLSLWC